MDNTAVATKRGPKPMTFQPDGQVAAGNHEMHTILRTISNAPNGIDHFSGAEVDAYVSTFLSAGWQLVSVHLLNYEKDGAAFAFFLVR